MWFEFTASIDIEADNEDEARDKLEDEVRQNYLQFENPKRWSLKKDKKE